MRGTNKIPWLSATIEILSEHVVFDFNPCSTFPLLPLNPIRTSTRCFSMVFRMNDLEEIEEFEDEDPDFGLEDNTPESLEVDEHREFVCLSCGAAFGTQDQLDIHRWSRHTK